MGSGRTADETPDEVRDRLFTGWRGAVLALVCLIMAGLAGAQLFAKAAQSNAFGPYRAATSGLVLRGLPQGWTLVRRVDPGSGGHRAGIRAGDMVRFGDPLVLSSNPPVGTVAPITVRHDGLEQHKLIAFQAIDPTMDATGIRLVLIGIAGSLFCWWLGVLVLWRGWGDRAALLLAIGLIGYLADEFIPWWMLRSPFTPLALGALAVLNVSGVCALVFPAYLYHVRIAPLGRAWGAVAIASAVLMAAVYSATTAMHWGLLSLSAPLHDAIGNAGIAAAALSCWWAWRGVRDAQGTERNRFIIVLLAQLLLLANWLTGLIAGFAPILLAGGVSAWMLVLLGWVAYPLVVSYAVLRHRVVDLGFALNRTLVFGSVSALLLGSFGLIEWGVEHWLPESWVRASVLIDAGAALLVYLVFHRIHGAIEHRVEHVFFHAWQTNETILRRFVGSAPHFEDERALARSFADELSRFAGEARVALYRRRDRTHDAILERVAGPWDTAPRTLPIDDPAFALMHAERRAIDLSDTLTDLPGVLALSMLDHGMLTGLVLMDLKGNGALYRPDEIDVLGWAAHNVALAMAALHAGQIEAENRLLKAQLTRLGSLIGDRLNHAEI